MKKLLGILGVLSFLIAPTICFADWIEPYEPNCKNTGYWGALNCDTLNSGDKGIAITKTWTDMAAASYVAYLSSGALGSDNQILTPATLISGGTQYTLAKADYSTQPYIRNITLMVGTTAGVALKAATGTGVIVGTDYKGDALTETINISTAYPVNSGYGVGSKAFRTVTSVTIAFTTITFQSVYGGTVNASSGKVGISMGTGVKIGIPADITASSEIMAVREAGSLTTTYTLSTTYDTIDFATDPDASTDYELDYLWTGN